MGLVQPGCVALLHVYSFNTMVLIKIELFHGHWVMFDNQKLKFYFNVKNEKT